MENPMNAVKPDLIKNFQYLNYMLGLLDLIEINR